MKQGPNQINENLAGEPVSRILFAVRQSLPIRIGNPNPQRDDHSSRSRIAPGLQQPTRGSQQSAPSSSLHTGWASPPLLFGLAPRGVFRAPDVATRAVGSYPTFSPLPNALDRNRQPCGFPQACRRGTSLTGGLIFCGTFRRRYFTASSRRQTHHEARPPGVTRRVALSLPSLARSQRSESGLSSRPSRSRGTNRRSSNSPARLSIAPRSKVWELFDCVLQRNGAALVDFMACQFEFLLVGGSRQQRNSVAKQNRDDGHLHGVHKPRLQQTLK